MTRVWLLLFTLLLITSSAATLFADTHDELVMKYISLKARGQQEFELGSRPIDEQSISQELRKKVVAFRDRIDNAAHQYYAGQLTDNELDKLIRWYGSTTGKKSAAALHKLFWPTINDMLVCAMGMSHVSPDSPDFFDRYKKLDECLHYTEEKTAEMESVNNDLLSRKGVFSPDSGAVAMPQLPPDELRAMKERLLKASKEVPRVYFAFCFLNLSEGEIQSCTHFYGSALGRKELELFKVRRKKLKEEIFRFFKENSEIIKSLKTPFNPPRPVPVYPENAR